MHYLEISRFGSETVAKAVSESASETPNSVSPLEKPESAVPIEYSGENRTRLGRVIKVPSKLDL